MTGSVPQWILVALGGAGGALARWQTSALAAKIHAPLPLATLSVNAAGSLLIGLLVGCFSQEDWFREAGRPLLVAGFLGAFTTFSSYSLEVVELLRAGRTAAAAGDALLQLAVGFSLTALGLWLGGFWR